MLWLALLLLWPASNEADKATSVDSLLQRIERGQRALIALARINVDQTRLAALELQRLRLLEREADMTGARDVAGTATSADSGSREPALISLSPGGETRIAPAGSVPSLRAETSRAVTELRRAREAIEQSIASLKARISKWEKFVDSLDETTTP